MLPAKIPKQPSIYHITFDEYLQPRQSLKNKNHQFDEQSKPELHLKLLDHPILAAARPNKIQHFLSQLQEQFAKRTLLPRSKVQTNDASDNVLAYARKWQLKTKLSKVHRAKNYCPSIPEFKLPNFLRFLRARNDDGLCIRKSGFEIYCEMASIHGFVNFVDAKTWQRAFWCLIIFIAMLLSAIIVVMSHLMTVATPTIMYTESTHHPAWTIAFPAITICNLNRLSRRKSDQLADKFSHNSGLSKQQMLQYFHLSLYNEDAMNATKSEYLALHQLLEQNNYTFTQFIKEISPDCETELLRCKWKGRTERCGILFQKVDTPQGICCSFNYQAVPRKRERTSLTSTSQTTSCGYKTGLTVILDPLVDDYMAGLIKSYGYQVLIHDAVNYPANNVVRQYVQSGTETSITIVPYATYATEFVRSEKVHVRRCYFADEGRLQYFPNGTQTNCLTECRSKIMANKCGCVPWYLPHDNGIRVCDFSDAMCFLEHKEIFYKILNETKSSRYYKDDRYAENFICDCYSECSYIKYNSYIDAGHLDRTYSIEDQRFFKGIHIKDHILLHVFYGDLVAQKYRLDVYENWLSFVGTFGGITGLYMGYSFVSGFELIFFAFVRPLCNWVTKKQIRYKIKQRQKKAAAEAAKKVLEQELQTRNVEETQNTSI